MVTKPTNTQTCIKVSYTGRFIMFSVITNIYNKKNQRTYLNGIVYSYRKIEKVFFYDIQVLATHASPC